MLKLNKILILLLVIVLSFGSVQRVAASTTVSEQTQSTELYSKLKSMNGVVAVEKMNSDIFEEKYKVVITQLIDPKNAEAGTFTQRFFVNHNGFDLPVVFITEGYTASYAERDTYIDEISKKLGCNMVVVEHRYFAESVPDAPWKYMTGFNAANDLHKINQGLRKIYEDKFITTGISKGGQTTILYKTYFPNDSDIAVPYVAPICFGIEDGRHEPFLENIAGDKATRDKIFAFQKEVLSRRDKMIPMLKKLIEEKKYEFEETPLDAVLDYCVLEYPFALWQWGTSIDKVLGTDVSDEVMFNEVIKTSGGADYFANMGPTAPFFVQAGQDLGYYGYDVAPFKGLLSIKSTKGYLKDIFMPADAKDIKFNNSLHKDIYKYLKKNDPKMIFIYGEWDPWTAAAAEEYLFEDKVNMMMFVEPEGSHRARIGTLPKSMEDSAWNTINKWLAE